ncbi:pyrroline-5-carboxylate reductase dimerization domain-containing protein [Helicobacter trogontum]|uniref:Pyrroline-5-carboxylate reductase n=1 Tax=Helicobacter trogontum TaxID=50960 RepID=A0A4U8SDK1_9HELI|nr:pyrroline-5-carboxylate reductase dimerization domain-containing protein [Helicobacter trogontum]TLD84141.1 pyrroline-5-carboxylate reductase [Helicobacter trogontum]
MELVVVGYGNMAKAILGGLIRQSKELLDITKIVIAGRAPRKIEAWLQESMQTCRSEFLNDVIYETTYDIECDGRVVLLACKPYNLDSFIFHGRAHIVYSVLAGINAGVLHNHIQSYHYALIMPNVGARYNLSSSAVLWQQHATKNQTIKEVGKVLNLMIDSHNMQEAHEKNNAHIQTQIMRFVSSFGNCEFVESEEELFASIATNGSSPALLALVAQGLINAGVKQGLKLETSQRLVQKTFEGMAALLKEKSPQEIKDLVTSPGGTTAEALLFCDENSVQGNITRACVKAVERAKEIASKQANI